jgi:hypothetical protein
MLQNASLFAVEFQTVLVSRYFIVSRELSVCVQPCCTLWLQCDCVFGTHKGQTVSKICLICVFKPVILPEVCVGVRLVLSHWGRNVGWCCSRTRELKRIFRPKMDEVTGEWRRLHNEELYALYCSPVIIRVIAWRRMRWAGRVAHMGERRCAYRILAGRHEGRRPLGRPRPRWEGNIKMDLQAVKWGGMGWITLA